MVSKAFVCKRSWADIVRSSSGLTCLPPSKVGSEFTEENPPPKMLDPSAAPFVPHKLPLPNSSGRSPLCEAYRQDDGFGRIIKMFSNFGWIIPLVDIKHPDVKRHGGRIYFSFDDLVATSDSEFRPGVLVNFELYHDDQGLGAERVSFVDDGYDETDDEGESTESDSMRQALCQYLPPPAQQRVSCDSIVKVPSSLVIKGQSRGGSTCSGSSDDTEQNGMDSNDEKAEDDNKVPYGSSLPLGFRPPPGLTLPPPPGLTLPPPGLSAPRY